MAESLTRFQLYSLLQSTADGLSLRDYLESSSCDVIVDVDFATDTYKRVYHAENKYFLPPGHYRFSELAEYMAEHIVHPDDSKRLREVLDPKKLKKRLRESKIKNFVFDDFLFRDRYGHYRYVEQCILYGPDYGLPKGIARCYGLDIHSLKLREAGLDKDVEFAEPRDEITGLIKDRDFLRASAKILEKNPDKKWCLAAIDIEHFRLYDEWFGHDKGDRLLRAIGAALREFCAARGGVAGYFLQDDFACFLPFVPEDFDKLYAALRAPFIANGAHIGFLPTIGVCQVWDKRDLAGALDKATVVAGDAKADIRNRIRFYDASFYRREEREHELLSAFMQALREGHITFFLQPQCRISNRKIVGAEALARWKRKDGSFVSPAEFIPLLEKYGFVSVLDQYLWDKVCAFQHSLLAAGKPNVPISVNVSRADLLTLDIVGYLTSLIQKYELPLKSIKVEITESSYTENASLVDNLVKELHEAGFTVWMDDFGSGYSSLNMLSTINVDAIKLDAAFLHFDHKEEVRGIHILESIVSMTKDLGLPTIIEGVETKEQVSFLEDLGCRYVQGYYFYKPMPTEDFHKLIEDKKAIDSRGFVFKSNEQFRIREFLDRNLYSDSMLNDILGPVGFYYVHDGVVDITRFNQQFYEAVGVPDFAERLTDIGRFMPEEDKPKFLDFFEQSANNRLNGAEGIFHFYRTNGTLTSFLMRAYYLGEKEKGKRYYVSARDITKLTDHEDKLNLMSSLIHDTVVFINRREGELAFEVAANGLRAYLGADGDELADEFKTRTFSKRLVDPGKREAMCSAIADAIHSKGSLTMHIVIRDRSGYDLPCVLDLRYVGDSMNNILFMLVLSKE
ncbi:MAG: GGDEF domain-containing protein [Erysipelotrichaceae bacterium]|nr:GGDEF domain-containing protein [Erysipelotrichaceae bacterium]